MRHIAWIVLFILGHKLLAQEHKAAFKPDSEIAVYGSSTLHDWTVTCEYFEGIVILKEPAGEAPLFEYIELGVEVLRMTGGKKAMDKDMWRAMNAQEFPQVTFQSSSIQVVREEDEQYAVHIQGKLRIHGETRDIHLDALLVRVAGSWRLSGEHKLHTTDYGIPPVSAIFGLVKTAEEVRIVFDLLF